MTMVPAQNLSKHHQLYYGGCGGSYTEEKEYYETAVGLLVGSDPVLAAASNPMAEDESRTTTTTTNYTTSACASLNNNGSSSNNNNNVDDASWLQLSIGSSAKTNPHTDATTPRRGGGLVELDLLPARSGSKGERVISQDNTRVPVAPIFQVPPPQVPSFLFQAAGEGSSSSAVGPPPPPHHQENINWTFRPAVLSIGTNSLSSPTSSSNPASFMQLGSYFARAPFQLHSGGVNVAGPSLDFRVIDPPRRPHSGIWFSLQALQNQAKEPFLPQIPKSYLRIRDGRMTVRLVMKYLVNKLRLDSESEVEITCRGQQLLPFLTLQHVRDTIWNPTDELTLLPDSSTTDHLMVLQYGMHYSKHRIVQSLIMEAQSKNQSRTGLFQWDLNSPERLEATCLNLCTSNKVGFVYIIKTNVGFLVLGLGLIVISIFFRLKQGY